MANIHKISIFQNRKLQFTDFQKKKILIVYECQSAKTTNSRDGGWSRYMLCIKIFSSNIFNLLGGLHNGFRYDQVLRGLAEIEDKLSG